MNNFRLAAAAYGASLPPVGVAAAVGRGTPPPPGGDLTGELSGCQSACRHGVVVSRPELAA